MDKIYLNELSLRGQYETIDEFLEAAIPIMKCLKFINDKRGNVYKRSTFFETNITKDKIWNDLRGVCGDKARRIKSLLLRTTDSPPFWDIHPSLKQDMEATYIFKSADVSGSSVAEAAEDNGILLSFNCEEYENRELEVIKNNSRYFYVPSASSINYLAESLWKNNGIDFHDFLIARYDGTRLDFSTLEEGYGFDDYEPEEIRDCLQSFDKFVKIENWEEIAKDRSLYYKQYSPSSKAVDWFRGDGYHGKTIYKFRCINPKRCFGYRDNDIFHVLRMERNHKISDNG